MNFDENLKTPPHLSLNTCCTTCQWVTSRHRMFYSRVVTSGRLVNKLILNRIEGTTRQDLFTSRHRNQYSRVVKTWRLVTETLIQESSRVDDSWQKLLFTSRQGWTTRDRNICSRVVTHARLVTPTRTIRTCIAFTLFPIIHVYFYKLVYYSNNLFIFLVYSLYCLNSFNFSKEKLSLFQE